ncbi:DUF3422 family protein [Frigidibacter sp. MR17.24]|uniref:DUF3422 family protein n=1 Tax=Frigidibacter sp. MR17.24 TaxID=3127345 RepID=UPI0030130F57
MQFDDHPLRYPLVNELHARPFPVLSAPCEAVYLAIKEPVDAANRDRARDMAHLVDLIHRHGGSRPEPGATHYSTGLGRHELKWESHTEFVTYSAFSQGLSPRAFDPAQAEIFPADWLAAAPGGRLAAVLIRVELMPETETELHAKFDDWFVGESLAVSRVSGGDAVIAGDFRLDPAGQMRFAVFVRPDTGPRRIGRIVQRLCEVETYRAMSMLGLWRARELNGALNGIEPRLAGLVTAMAEDGRPAEDRLHDLLAIAAELEAEATRHAFRFGATGAYEAIVLQRLEVMREERYDGRQSFSEFFQRRYDPAMRTVKSAERRLQQLVERATRAGDLLRTRVDVERQGQNQRVLESMDRRSDLQLRLQHTVEGLSVVAISYYAFSLVNYVAYPFAEAWHLPKSVTAAILVPVVVLAVWAGLRRIRKGMH